jgi:phage recombination protein Bet
MNNNEEKKELSVVYEVDGETIKLTPSIVQNFIIGTEAKITLPEFTFFTKLCKARGLNPFLKEAYCIKFGKQPAQIIVGKDAILKRAIRNQQFNGMETGVIVKVTETGEIIERKGTFFDAETEKLVGGWAKVYRKDWEHPTYCSVSFAEVAQKKSDGSLNSNWAGKGATMVEKVAKVRALRETFVDDLGGMYEAEETSVSIDNTTEPAEIKEPEIIQQEEPTEQPVEVTFNEL